MGMSKRDWFWIILILVFLLLVALVSGAFYFNLIAGGIETGHVVFEDNHEEDEDESGLDYATQDAGIPTLEGEIIFEEIEEAG